MENLSVQKERQMKKDYPVKKEQKWLQIAHIQ